MQCGYIDAGIIPKFSYCDYGISWFKQRGAWQDRNYIPSPGTIIFFDWDSNGISDHVAIVESCDGNTVYTIEGNANNACKAATLPRWKLKIEGYGVPAYS